MDDGKGYGNINEYDNINANIQNSLMSWPKEVSMGYFSPTVPLISTLKTCSLAGE